MGLFGKIAGSFVNERVSNTKTALQLIIEDFKRYVFILKYVFLAFSVLTLTYSIITNVGILAINIALLAILLIYTVLDAILKRRENQNPTKVIRKIYAWMKIVLNALALLSSLYTLYAATDGATIKPFSIVLATLSIIMFVLKVLVEIVLDILNAKWRLLKTGMVMDANEFPNTSGRLFGPILGELVDDPNLKQSDVERINSRKR